MKPNAVHEEVDKNASFPTQFNKSNYINDLLYFAESLSAPGRGEEVRRLLINRHHDKLLRLHLVLYPIELFVNLRYDRYRMQA